MILFRKYQGKYAVVDTVEKEVMKGSDMKSPIFAYVRKHRNKPLKIIEFDYKDEKAIPAPRYVYKDFGTKEKTVEEKTEVK